MPGRSFTEKTGSGGGASASGDMAASCMRTAARPARGASAGALKESELTASESIAMGGCGRRWGG